MSNAPKTSELRELVSQARQRQLHRWAATNWRLNSAAPGVELRKNWPATDEGIKLLEQQVRSNKTSPRSADRVLRLAWSVADLCGHDRPNFHDVQTALDLRRGSPVGGDVAALLESA